jgi:hypothetical protein
MNRNSFSISDLVDDLQPVRNLSTKRGLILPAIFTGIALLVVGTQMGWRSDLIAGRPSEMFLLRAGILALLGGASAHAVIAMASPAVGKHSDRWQMALAAALLFPLAAIIAVMGANWGTNVQEISYGAECLAMSMFGGLGTAIPAVMWLRKGAPTSLERAGWLTGIASGALGAFAYNFHCPNSDIVYTGVWYSIAVGTCAISGRLIVPRLIRW